MLLSNVGDISAETAQQTLIMANAGYQLGNDYQVLNTLISQFNELANKNAIEVDTLTGAWQNSANIAKQAKLSIEDYNAMITVAGSVTQKSGDEIGNGLKTILMRLQGVTDGAETLDEDVSKVDRVLSDLGIQIKKSPTEFRPAMQVLSEISAKYKELGKSGETVKQSELLETLAGKYRANILAGILNNFDQINKAVNDQTNSYQSAENENSRYMESIEAKTKSLQAQWELLEVIL
jgi:TP901 family phage tail tape measure protein